MNNISNQNNIKPEFESELEVNTESESESELEIKTKSDYLNEKYLDSKFIGYYLDTPDNPILTDYLGEVDNTNKCIIKGKDSNYKYIGLQQGNKCFGTNILPNNLKQTSRRKNIIPSQRRVKMRRNI